MARELYVDQVCNPENRPVYGVKIEPGVNVSVHEGARGDDIFWADETTSAERSYVRTNRQGFFAVWLTEGRYDITIPHYQINKTVSVINEESVSSGASESERISHVEVDLTTEETTRKTADEALAKAISEISTGMGLEEAEVKEVIDASWLVPSKLVNLGAVAGSVTPNMANGQVFTMTTAAPIEIQAPSNGPKTGKALYVELWIAGEEEIEVPGVTKWIGESPVFDLSGPGSINVIMLVSKDEGSTWYGLSSQQIPAGVVSVSGATNGQVPIWNSSSKEWEPGTPEAGLTELEVEELIEAKALVVDFPMHLEGECPAEGEVFRTKAGNASAEFVSLTDEILLNATARQQRHAEITTSQELESNKYYPVGKPNLTLKLPQEVLVGTLITVANNNAVGTTPIKVEGRQTIGEPGKVTDITEVLPGEAITYRTDNEKVWFRWLSYLTLAQIEETVKKVAAGAWEELNLNSGKVEVATGVSPYTNGARVENSGSTVRMRGILQITAGKTLKTTERLCTLPSGRRPVGSEDVWVTARTAASPWVMGFRIDESGRLFPVEELAAGTKIALDSITFSIT